MPQVHRALARCLFGRILLLLIAFASVASAEAQFVRGRVYVSVTVASDAVNDYSRRILELDPSTQTWRDFALFPETAGRPNGLAFDSAGTRLRVAMSDASSIIEIYGDGSMTTVLDDLDGFSGNGTRGANNIVFDNSGSFYASTSNNVSRFPPNGAPRADLFPGGFDLSMASAVNGSLYYTGLGGQSIWRYLPGGSQELVDSWNSPTETVYSLALSKDHALYALINNDIYRYPTGGGIRQLLVSGIGSSALRGSGAIALTEDETRLYLAVGSRLYSIDVENGQYFAFPQAPVPAGGVRIGAGIAVYVPEPCGLLLCVLGSIPALVRTRTRQRRGCL